MEWREFNFNVIEDEVTSIPVYTEEELTERVDKGLPITKKEIDDWSNKVNE